MVIFLHSFKFLLLSVLFENPWLHCALLLYTGKKEKQHNELHSIKKKVHIPYALIDRRWTVELLDFNLPTLPVHVFWVRFILPPSWDQSRNIDALYGSQHSAVCCGVFLMYSTESGSCLIKRPLCSLRSIASIMPSLSGGWHNCLL